MFSFNSVCALLVLVTELLETWAQIPVPGNLGPGVVWQTPQGPIGGPIPRYTAIARLFRADTSEQNLMGQVQFLQYSVNTPTTIIGLLQLPYNIPRDQYLGMHIHEYGDISEQCKWVGRHFNPHGQVHGGPWDFSRHEGDLGNIQPTGNIALINISAQAVQLAGLNTVIGRSLVIHVQRDDFGRGGQPDSLIDGHSGFPLACGVIGIKGDFSPASAVATGPCGLLIFTCCLVFASLLQGLHRKR